MVGIEVVGDAIVDVVVEVAAVGSGVLVDVDVPWLEQADTTRTIASNQTARFMTRQRLSTVAEFPVPGTALSMARMRPREAVPFG